MTQNLLLIIFVISLPLIIISLTKILINFAESAVDKNDGFYKALNEQRKFFVYNAVLILLLPLAFSIIISLSLNLSQNQIGLLGITIGIIQTILLSMVFIWYGIKINFINPILVILALVLYFIFPDLMWSVFYIIYLVKTTSLIKNRCINKKPI